MTLFDLDRIARETFVRRIAWLDETPSTNTVALNLAETDEGPLPLLVVAERQTAGRGRGANRWWSSAGALTFSLVLDASPAQLPPARRALASLAAGLAACETIEALAPAHAVGVKWPNDVHVEGKKICGILVESACGEKLVVGLGLNVNNSRAEAPEDVAERAIALVDVLGQFTPLTEALTRLLQALSRQWDSLRENDSRLIENLRQRCVLTGRIVEVQLGEERVAGLCRGIADDGALLIDAPPGPRKLYAGVVVSIG